MMNFLKDESGQGMVEYALIIGLIAIVVIAAVTLLGGKVGDLFNGAAEELESAGVGKTE